MMKQVTVLAALVVLSSLATAQAATIYEENFDGEATTDLHGTSPDIDNNGGTNTWVAHSSFKADGTTGGTNTGAWLPFSPVGGKVYTLDLSLSGVGPDGATANWFAMGFSQNVPSAPETGPNRFIEGPTLGRAWMLFRANNPNPNQLFLGDAAGALAQVENWAAGSPVEGGDIDMRIVLDTTGGAGNFAATYFAKRPTDASYTQISSGTLALLAEDIGAVGFARNASNVTGSAESFRLTVVPEPTSLALLFLGCVVALGASSQRRT